VSRQIVIAYWLIPTEPARSFFQGIIDTLARRYGAPVFEPHMTVHVGENCTDKVDGVFSSVPPVCDSIVLKALDVGGSSEFIKTLFVQFATNKRLQLLNESVRTAARDLFHYRFNPHLSLLYKKISVQDRRLLMRSIEVPFPEVTFDSLKAVRCISPTRNRADVEAWRVMAEKARDNSG
jgi:2'-5' RNA ligase